MLEISKQFRFESAHTLHRGADVETGRDASKRIHGHSYRAEVVVRGKVLDFGILEGAIEEARSGLDHHFLNEVPDLGPATMENLSIWIWRKVAANCQGLSRVTVFRDSTGEKCSYFGPKRAV
jgi:6-pyruvoyltetrahydropterin/6-carboxytetrahydropterin synthase